MADAQSNLFINIDTTQALANIRALQAEISAFQTAMVKGNAKQQQIAQGLQRQLLNTVNATGQFSARMTTIASTTESFTNALEKNRLSMREYYRYGMASTKSFGRFFRSEFETINKVARERVKTLQTQYVKMGRDANGALRAIAVRPLALDMENLATKTALAAQRQQIFNQLLKQGSTNLLNFGKNTQWAGRQLMVGFTIPLAIMGTAAIREFRKIEEQAVRFRRVYGDAFSNTEDTEKALENIKTLATEFTKYGIAVEKTIGLAADVAQMGNVGQDLVAQVTEATRLAVLGGIEQQDALNTTISLTSAFGTAAEDLAKKIDFLNSVENQTVLSIEDFNEAIPKAGPVVQQLGGSVEDLAFFLTAMREGGINASEAANALKSGLASIINPTDKAAEFVGKLGINLKGIVEANKGDVKATVIGLAQALDTLDPLNRARAIEQLFGKFQFARISTLFQNVIKEGSQAQQVLRLTQATTAELAALSERELRRVEESPAFKLQKQIEKLKASLAPVGEEFIKLITPLIDFATKILDQFNNLDSGVKTFITGTIAVLGGIAPVALMAFGLLANGVANIIKLFGTIRGVYQKAGSQSQILGQQTQYMTQEQLEAAAVAASLNQSHNTLIQTFTAEVGALNNLAAAYSRVANAQAKAAAGFGPGIATNIGKKPKKMRAGGVVQVPGSGSGDKVPALLEPGEAVIPKKMAKKYSGFIDGMISDSIPGFQGGVRLSDNTASTTGIIAAHGSDFRAISDAEAKEFARNNLTPGTRAYENFMKETGRGRNLYSNLVFGMPGMFNTGNMTGADASRWVRGNKDAFYSYLTNMYGLDPNAPASRTFANSVAQRLNSFGAEKIDDKKFYDTIARSAKGVANREFREIFNRAATSFATGEIFGSSGKSRREALAGAGPSYTRRRATIRKDFNEPAKRFESSISGVVRPSDGVRRPANVERVGGKPADTRMAAVAPGETVLNRQSTRGIRRGLFSFIPGLGVLGRFDGIPEGQRTLPGMPPLPGFQQMTKPEQQVKEAGKLFNKEAFKPSNLKKSAGTFGNNMLNKFATAAERGTGPMGKLARSFTVGLANVAGNQLVDSKGNVINAGAAGQKGLLGVKPLAANAGQVVQSGNRFYQVNEQGKKIRVSNAVGQQMMAQQQSAAMPKQSRLPRIMGGAGAVAGMASMGAMMYSMGGGPGADIAGQAMMPLMMMSMILPLLGSKVGLVVAGLAAVVGGFVAVQMALENTRKASRDAALEMSSGKDAMLRFAEAAGTVTPDEYMDQVRANQFSPFVVKPGKTTFGQAFVETEAGTGMIESFKKQVEQFGRSDAIEGLTRQLTTAVATGVLSPAQAKSIALSFGSKLEDFGITANISAAISSITGPDGKVLEGNTIKIYTELIQGSTTGLTGEGGLLQTEDLTGGAPVFWWDSEKVAKAEGEAAALIQRTFDESQQIVDALDMQYNKQIEALYNEGKIEEALAKEEEYQQKRKQIVEEYNKQVAAITKDFANVEKGKQDAILRLLVDSAKKIDPAIGAAADRLRNVTRGSVKISGATEEGVTNEQRAAQREAAAGIESAKVTILAQLAAGNIDAETFNNLMKTFDPTTGQGAIAWNALAKISTDVSPAALSQLETVFTVLEDPEQAANIVVKISQMDPTEAQNTVDTLTQIATYDGKDIEAKVVVDYFTNDPEALDDLTSKFEKIDELKKQGKLDVEALIKEKVIPAEVSDTFEKFGFDKMSPGEQQTFTKVFVSKYVSIQPDEIAAWKAANPFLAQFYSDQQIGELIAGKAAEQRTEAAGADTTAADITPDTGPGPGGTRQDPYEDILRRLKEIRDGAINAAGGMKELNRVIGDGTKLTPFKGLENQLIKMGRTAQFTDWLLGLDPAQMKKFATVGTNGLIKLTKAGIQMQQAFNELAIGEVVVGLQRVQLETKQQNNALKKLMDAGLDVADAYELIQDKAFAAAVSSRQMSPKELAEIVRLQKQVTEELQKQINLENVRKDIQDAIDRINLDNRIDLEFEPLEGYFVKNDETLRAMYDLGQAGAEEFARRLKQLTSNPETVMGAVSSAYGVIEQTFGVLEEQINAKYDKLISRQERIIAKAQDEIRDLQNKADKYQDYLDDIQEEEDKINEAYEKRAKALDQISRLNDIVAQRDRARLTVADAISRGDIASAAAAIQELRAQEAKQALDQQSANLEYERELALSSLVAANGMTRKELEKEIRDIQKEIKEIQDTTIRDAEYRIAQLQSERDQAIQNLTVMGQTREEWRLMYANINAAYIATEQWVELLRQAAALMKQINEGGFSTSGESGGSTTTDGGSTLTEGDVPTIKAALNEKIQKNRDLVRSGTLSEAEKNRLMKENEGYIQQLRFLTDDPTTVGGLASGGMVPKYLRMGGLLPYKAEGGSIFKPLGTDTIPAMLSPGEFVIRKYAVDNFGVDKLKAINSGTYNGDSVYNYGITLNVASTSNADEIAHKVMTQIRRIDSQRLRSSTF